MLLYIEGCMRKHYIGLLHVNQTHQDREKRKIPENQYSKWASSKHSLSPFDQLYLDVMLSPIALGYKEYKNRGKENYFRISLYIMPFLHSINLFIDTNKLFCKNIAKTFLTSVLWVLANLFTYLSLDWFILRSSI